MITTTEFMLWELTLISLLTGMLLGIIGTILAFNVMAKFNLMEKKAQKYDDLEQKFLALQKSHRPKEEDDAKYD